MLAYAGYVEIVLAYYRSIDNEGFNLFTFLWTFEFTFIQGNYYGSWIGRDTVHFVAHALNSAFELGIVGGWTIMCWHLISSKTTTRPVLKNASKSYYTADLTGKFFFIDLYLNNNFDDLIHKIMPCRTTPGVIIVTVWVNSCQFQIWRSLFLIVSLKWIAMGIAWLLIGHVLDSLSAFQVLKMKGNKNEKLSFLSPFFISRYQQFLHMSRR